MPHGNIFQRGSSKQNNVFIAGGTGITPFVSLFTDKSFAEYTNPVLHAGFRTSIHQLFENEIASGKKINNSFKTNIELQGENEILDIEKIYRENKSGTFFISGPPMMVTNFRNFLLKKGVEEIKIITENWEYTL